MVDHNYEKFKKKSIIMYDGNPSTGHAEERILEIQAQKRHDELFK